MRNAVDLCLHGLIRDTVGAYELRPPREAAIRTFIDKQIEALTIFEVSNKGGLH